MTNYKKVSKEDFDKQIEYCIKNFGICLHTKYDDYRKSKNHKAGICRVAWFLYHDVSISYLSYVIEHRTYAFKCNRSDLENKILQPTQYSCGYGARSLRSYIPDITERKPFGAHEVIRDGKTKIDWNIRPVVAKVVTPKPGTYEHCYHYDVNSAYLASYLKPMPDTDTLKLNAITNQNQVGFDEDGEPHIADGQAHLFVFDLKINEKLAEYAQRVYKKYQDAKASDDKQKALDVKFQYTAGNGCVKNFNIFYYNMIIWYAKKNIEKYAPKDTLYISTDSIIAPHKIEVPVSKELGDFKIEHEDAVFMATETSCNFEGEAPKQKGAHACTRAAGFVLDIDNEYEKNEILYDEYTKDIRKYEKN